jgi:hypothetical protein
MPVSTPRPRGNERSKKGKTTATRRATTPTNHKPPRRHYHMRRAQRSSTTARLQRATPSCQHCTMLPCQCHPTCTTQRGTPTRVVFWPMTIGDETPSQSTSTDRHNRAMSKGTKPYRGPLTPYSGQPGKGKVMKFAPCGAQTGKAIGQSLFIGSRTTRRILLHDSFTASVEPVPHLAHIHLLAAHFRQKSSPQLRENALGLVPHALHRR